VIGVGGPAGSRVYKALGLSVAGGAAEAFEKCLLVRQKLCLYSATPVLLGAESLASAKEIPVIE